MTSEELKPCREAFESWYEDDGFLSLERYSDSYKDAVTHRCWMSWKAAWNTRAASPVDLDEIKAEMMNSLIGSETVTPDNSNLVSWMNTVIERLRHLGHLHAKDPDVITIKRADLEAMKEAATAIRITDYAKGYGDGINKIIDKLLGDE
jgi:hypothetical protein